MRIWDIHPGYLNRQSLLGEHRELHAIVSIIVNRKKGYARHPETLRWIGCRWALGKRHQMLAAEMRLRGYNDYSPVLIKANRGAWPETFVDEPARQFEILEGKYRDREQGRIPLPKSAQQLWIHHKYSVLARDPKAYREIGRRISGMTRGQDFSALARQLSLLLRDPPTPGSLKNALQHMWGHVSDDRPVEKGAVEEWSPSRLLEETKERALGRAEPYLTSSTALSELRAWMPGA